LLVSLLPEEAASGDAMKGTEANTARKKSHAQILKMKGYNYC